MSMAASVTLIIPDALREKANRVACAFGYDAAPLPGDTYSRPLSANGTAPATHWGCHTWATEAFVLLLGALQDGGTLPPLAWASFGLTSQDVSDVLGAVLVSVQGIDAAPLDHWGASLSQSVLAPLATTSQH